MRVKPLIEKALDETGSTIEVAALCAFIAVETGGKGFDEKTGKILIQFEPHWFKRREPFAPSGRWSVNKVDVPPDYGRPLEAAWLCFCWCDVGRLQNRRTRPD